LYAPPNCKYAKFALVIEPVVFLFIPLKYAAIVPLKKVNATWYHTPETIPLVTVIPPVGGTYIIKFPEPSKYIDIEPLGVELLRVVEYITN
jgi:hypothetical protein